MHGATTGSAAFVVDLSERAYPIKTGKGSPVAGVITCSAGAKTVTIYMLAALSNFLAASFQDP
jgi:hypothetical protein